MEMQILAWHREMKKTNLLGGQVDIIVVCRWLLFVVFQKLRKTINWVSNFGFSCVLVQIMSLYMYTVCTGCLKSHNPFL